MAWRNWMKNVLYVGVATALITGLLIGAQATLSGRLGGIIGPVRTGLMMNMMGGSLAFIVFLSTLVLPIVKEEGAVTPRAWAMLFAGGLLGVFIVVGVSFSITRVGVTAGLGTIILGQMLISSIVDVSGWGGVEPIPFTSTRLVGLLVLGLAVYLLLPKTT